MLRIANNCQERRMVESSNFLGYWPGRYPREAMYHIGLAGWGIPAIGYHVQNIYIKPIPSQLLVYGKPGGLYPLLYQTYTCESPHLPVIGNHTVKYIRWSSAVDKKLRPMGADCCLITSIASRFRILRLLLPWLFPGNGISAGRELTHPPNFQGALGRVALTVARVEAFRNSTCSGKPKKSPPLQARSWGCFDVRKLGSTDRIISGLALFCA